MKTARRSSNLAARLPRQALDKTRLPVLLPREGVIDTAKAKMVSFGDAYALNMPQNKGIQVTMYGNRSFVAGDKGAQVEFTEVLMVGAGGEAKVGTPAVAGARVVAEVVEQSRAPKVIAFKKRRRKNSRRKRGHRQHQTLVRIKEIVGA